LQATLVQFSTDYVYGSRRGHNSGYKHTDNPGPVNVYGMSKLAGEHVVQAECSKHFIIRTCGLYGIWGAGGKGTNFVETMLKLAERGGPIRVVNDQRCTPSYTADIAAKTVELLATQRYGLYHLTNGGSTTWFEFALAIFMASKVRPDLQPISSAEYGALARRPSFSVLDNSLFKGSLGIEAARPWRQALEAYLEQRKLRQAASAVAPY
jgi:dTDP-4-dehydrorhamnose reductase